MEEDSSDSQSPIFIPESNIRVIESHIQAQLDSFEKEVADTTFLETSNVCDNVRDQILYHEDDPHLSKTQNNCRRIFIATDLFINICSIYGHIVDNEFTKIINDLVQWEKYKQLSSKIMHKMHLETKREKYFAKEAKSRLLKSLEDAEKRTLGEKETEAEGRENALRPLEDSAPVSRLREDVQQVTAPMEDMEQILMSLEGKETETAFATISEREALEVASGYGNNETFAPTLESSSRDYIVPDISGNLTEIRAEPATDTSRLQYPISNISTRDLSLPDTVAEPSIKEPLVQDQTDDDLNRILQILEDQISQKEIGNIIQPTEPADRIPEVPQGTAVEELQTDGEKQAEESKTSEEWSLPSLEPVERTRKKTRLIIDEATFIPEYAARALHLNRNIIIQRVQVFEGPPNILQGISVNHLMRTPGFKSSLFQDVRSSRLSALYSRHLELEKKPVEPVLPTRVAEKNRDDVSNARATVEILEVGERVGMRSLFEKSDMLTELLPDKSRLEDIEIPAAVAPPKESLIGMPMSRIISSIIEPPEEAQMERINSAPILPTPRVQELQGKSLDPKPSSPWFLSSKQNPPRGKYREFNYVYKKLLQYWALFEIQGMEKSITLREFFSFEEDASVANYLTALRIVDKLSIQRKLLLEFKNNDVFIKPFESPYVSDEQLLLKGREPLL